MPDCDSGDDPCFRNGVGNGTPQCRIHGKIANFGTLGNNFGHLDSNFGITPGRNGLHHQQQATQPFHPGLHLNNWAKNFPPHDEVRLQGEYNQRFLP